MEVGNNKYIPPESSFGSTRKDLTFSNAELEKWSPEIRHALSALSEHQFIALEDSLDAEGKRIISCDIEKFKGNFNWHEMRSRLGKITMTAEGKKKTKIQTLADIFLDLHVVSSKAKGDQPRRLFYMPENDAASLDIEQIKQAEQCYLGFWQVPGGLDEYPLKVEQPSDAATPNEVSVAALVFHPSFGDGIRGNDGVLRVKYANGDRKSINSSYFREQDFGNRQFGIAQTLKNSPRSFLETAGGKLVDKGLLRLTDFRTRHGGAGEQFRILGRKIPENGQVMLNGQRLYVGRENSSLQITQVSPEIALLLEDTADSSHIVEVIVLPAAANAKGYISTKKWNKYEPSEFRLKHPELTPILQQFSEYLEFSQRLSREQNLNLATFSAREQTLVWLVFKEFGQKEEFWRFIEKQGSDGLLALMVAEDSLPEAQKIFEISQNPQAGFLFENIASILRTVGSSEEYVNRTSESSAPDVDRVTQVSNMILKHAGKLFLSAYEISSKETDISLQDITHALYRYRRQVENWHQDTFLRGNLEENKYLQLLNIFDQAPEGSNVQTLLLDMIQQFWEQDVVREAKRPENQSLVKALARIKDFYAQNPELFETATTTTGDTEKELAGLEQFFATFNRIDGLVVDLACGDRKRITEPIADMIAGKAKVYGLDIWSPGKNTHSNLEIVEGSIGAMPFADHSVAIATLNWSPPNDWVSRTEQLVNFGELGRVMKPGGVVRADVAYLEGGDSSWMPEVVEQFEATGGKFGDVKLIFPGERQGEFHIYPLSEIKAHLANAGFGEMQIHVWRTRAGKPRVTMTANYLGKSNPLN